MVIVYFIVVSSTDCVDKRYIVCQSFTVGRIKVELKLFSDFEVVLYVTSRILRIWSCVFRNLEATFVRDHLSHGLGVFDFEPQRLSSLVNDS